MIDQALERRARTEPPARGMAIGPRRPPRSTRRQRLGRMWAVGELQRRALLTMPLVAVIFSILAFGGVYAWAYGGAYVLIYASLAVYAIRLWRGQLPFIPRAVYAPMLAFGLLSAASYIIGWTAVRGSTLTAMLHLLPAGIGFFLATQLFRPRRDYAWLPKFLAVFTGALAFTAIVQLFTAGGAIYWLSRYTFASPAGPYVNRNHFAGCMELLIPMASVEAYRRRHRGWMQVALWAAAPGLGIAAVVLSASRGGAVALTVEVLSAIALLTLPFGPGPRQRRHGDPSGILALFTMLLVAMVCISLVGIDRLEARFLPQTASVDSVNVQTRSLLNRSSLAMWRMHPVAGFGLGTWADIYPAYALFGDFRVYEFAHNDYLQMLAETGLIGAACAIWFWILWTGAIAHNLRQQSDPQPPPRPAQRRRRLTDQRVAFGIAVVAGCLGILVHSWFDFNLHIPANLLLFFLIAGLGIS